MHSANSPKRIEPTTLGSIVQGHRLVDCERLTNFTSFARRTAIPRPRAKAEEPQLELEPSGAGLACSFSCFVASLRACQGPRAGWSARKRTGDQSSKLHGTGKNRISNHRRSELCPGSRLRNV